MSDLSFARTRQDSGLPPFIVDQHAVVRDNGRQIDWDALGDAFVNDPQIVKLAAVAAPGAVTLTVEPLPVDLRIGDVLNFGVLEQVTVTVGVAGASANDTSVPVDALSGPIPAGTLLDFGGKKFARLSAAAAAGATSITVDAIPTALVDNDAAIFEGGQLIAYVDAAAAAGAEEVTVEDLALGIPDESEAIVPGSLDNDEVFRGRRVKAGTVVDLLASGKVVPSSEATSGVTAYGILATNADEFSKTDAASGYGVIVSASVYENLLPDAEHASLSTWKTELLARGGFWLFQTYADNTVE